MKSLIFCPLGIVILAAPLAGLVGYFAPRAVGDDANFKPIIEAEMPKGFPEYTPVQDVQIKRYPAYRRAEADPETGGGFWTLFMHIKKNDIPMTAPVEMRYADGERPRESSMSFLYGRPDMGKTGRQGKVEVVDVPPMVVVSTGVRGARTAKTVAAARDRLKTWLDANQSRYAADGEMRVMAYNSPFVPRDRNYFEVEIPVRPLDSTESAEKKD